MKLEGVSEKVFKDRYALKNKAGDPIEKDPKQMWARVARGIAKEEKPSNRKHWEDEFNRVMQDFRYVPGGRVLAGAGTGYDVTYYNCYVIPNPPDSRNGILENLGHMVEIMAHGGGVGVNLSSLRPRGARVSKVNGYSSGQVNWAELYSVATHDIIQQGGCFAPNTRIMTHRGLIPMEEIVQSKENYFAATHRGYKKVETKFNNGTKDIYEIKTETGFKVEVTAEHKFVTFNDNGEFYLKPLKEFTKGEKIVLLLGDWLKDLPPVSLNTNLPQPSKYSYGRKEVNLPEELTQDLAYILGGYDADGSKIQDQHSPNGKGICFAMAENKPEDLTTLVSAIKRVFGVEPKLHKGDGAVINIHLFSRKVNEFLVLNNLLKQSSINVIVPEQIYRSPKNVVEAYIAGVFTGDGTNQGGKGGLRIATVSHQFAETIQLLLLNLKIAARINTRVRRHKKWRTIYTVTVNGATFMRRFVKLLAPYTQKVLDKRISIRDGAYSWPMNLVNRFTYVNNLQRTMARRNPKTSQKSIQFLQTQLATIKTTDTPDLEYLSNCIPDTITSIIPKGKTNVYDLEVADIHRLSGNGIYTSNSRRGALMIMLWDWHPDVQEFINVKRDLTRIRGANLSVCVSDKFMEAVKNDDDWDFIYPDINDPKYDKEWDGYMQDWLDMGGKVNVHSTVRARDLWDQICEAAWNSAEPGVVFMERCNKRHNNYYFNRINCVNPCGEEPLPPWGVCNLGSLNLTMFVDDKGNFDYDLLADHVKVAVRFQDNVIDGDVYIFEGIRKTQLEGERRIGIGTMGLADALIMMKIRYGSEKGLEVIEKIYKLIRDVAYEESAELAKEKGAFPKFQRNKYLNAYFIKQLPERIRKKISKYGVRNSVILMQAPTGSTSLMAGVSSGIEPVFEFSFTRRDRLGEHKIFHPLYDAWRKDHPNDERPDYFVSAADLTPQNHLRVQAAIQKYVDASISKTVNAPADFTVEDVKNLYTMAYDLGCKGVTFMREGSRPGVLERETDKKEDKPEVPLTNGVNKKVPTITR